MRTSDDPAQRRLPLTREERLHLIDGVDPEAAGVGRRQWRTVHSLLKTLEFCSTGGDSHVRVEILMAKMQVDRRTVQRARAAAEGAGLLAVASRSTHNGQASNLWQIDWGRVWAVQENRAADLPPMGGAMPPPRGELPPPRGELPPPLRNTRALDRLLGPSKQPVVGGGSSGYVETPGGDRRFVVGIRTAKATTPAPTDGPPPVERVLRGAELNAAAMRGIATLIEQKIGRRRSDGDWPLALKAAALVPQLGEVWLWDSVEAVVRKRPPATNVWAYFHRCLDERAKLAGVRLSRELSRIVLPAELLAEDGATAREFSERMCVKMEE
jgi:hypothetical protein